MGVAASLARAAWNRFRTVRRVLGLTAGLAALGMVPWDLKVSSPFQILPVQPTQYVGVLRDVIGVIQFDETAVKHRPISG